MMSKYVRRSLLTVPLSSLLPEWALKAGSDVVVLDLGPDTTQERQNSSQSQIALAIRAAAETGAEVFVRIRPESTWADLELTVWPGLTGIVLARVQSPEDVAEASQQLTKLEQHRGIPKGSLLIDAEIGSAMGALNSLDIARSSPRLCALTVGETSLYHDLHLDPEAALDQDPLRFIKGQILVNARAAGLQAQGMSYPLSITLAKTDETQLKQAVRRARDTGFKGAVCPHASWVKICNEGFRPSQDELAYYVKVKEVFEDGLRRGLASVPLEGRMVDVPVYRRAQVFLEWGEACARRDKEKQGRLAGS
jgi:citrate lyase subunit beta/citryl-CoA lyase